MKFLASRFLWRTGTCSLFTIQKKGYRLRFHPTALSATLWIDPEDRQGDEVFLQRYLKPGDVFIDAGANIGDLTLTAASVVGQGGRVYSIEAHPRTYRFLSMNITLNNCTNIALFNLALGEKQSEIFFVDLGRSDDQNRVSENGRGISVKMRTLDELPIEADEIHLLKIDVEGYEKFVLEGAAKILEKTSCIYFESWDTHYKRYGYTCEDVMTLLAEKGFRVFRFTGKDELASLQMPYSSPILENLLAVRSLDEFLKRTQLHLAT